MITGTEEIRTLVVKATGFQVRAGKQLTTIELMAGERHSGRDIVIKNETELEDLIASLTQTREWLKTK